MSYILSFVGKMTIYMLITLAVYTPMRIIFLKIRKTNVVLWREILLAVFICYIIGVFSMTVFPNVRIDYDKELIVKLFFSTGNSVHVSKNELSYFKNNEIYKVINLIPFKTISEYFFAPQNTNYAIRDWNIIKTTNLLGNFLLFLPLGFILPLLNNRFKSFLLTLLASSMFIIGIEVIQYFIGRAADIDDFMINLTGVFAGFIFFILSSKIIKFTKRRVNNE